VSFSGEESEKIAEWYSFRATAVDAPRRQQTNDEDINRQLLYSEDDSSNDEMSLPALLPPSCFRFIITGRCSQIHFYRPEIQA